MHVRETFVSDDALALSFRGNIDTEAGAADAEVLLRKRLFSKFLTRVDVGAWYRTRGDEVRYYLGAKKKVGLNSDGLTAFEARASASVCPGTRQSEWAGRLQLTQKVFNFTEDQDLKLKAGYDLRERKFFAQVRENNWTLRADSTGYWGVAYDLCACPWSQGGEGVAGGSWGEA